MWVRGKKTDVSLWYVLWVGRFGTNADFYMTPYGLRQWLLSKSMQAMPVLRVGRFTLTPSGLQEVEHWNTREEFLAA